LELKLAAIASPGVTVIFEPASTGVALVTARVAFDAAAVFGGAVGAGVALVAVGEVAIFAGEVGLAGVEVGVGEAAVGEAEAGAVEAAAGAVEAAVAVPGIGAEMGAAAAPKGADHKPPSAKNAATNREQNWRLCNSLALIVARYYQYPARACCHSATRRSDFAYT
jgi:hypothetical protein